jgi:hypothetical protein
MWVFITARFRRWLLFAIAVPLATTAVHLLRQVLEKRTGATRLTRVLGHVEDLGQRRRR